MLFFYVLFIIVGVIYSSLSILAGAIALKFKLGNKISSYVMTCGGIIITLTLFKNLIFCSYTLYFLIFGLLLIHGSAIFNGFKMFKKFNIKHNLIRLLIEASLITFFLLS